MCRPGMATDKWSRTFQRLKTSHANKHGGFIWVQDKALLEIETYHSALMQALYNRLL